MLSTFLNARMVAKMVLPTAAALLFFSTGCGREHCNSCSSCTSCASDSTQYQAIPSESAANYPASTQAPMYSQAVAAPSYAPASMSAPQSAPIAGLRGPRSQAELDSIFNNAAIQPLPPMPAPSPEQPAPAPAVGGEASWNVPLSREWRHIVVHHSASPTGSAASFDKAHRDRGWDGLGYHFVIGNGSGSGDGQVEVGYRWTRQLAGAHAGNYEYNQHGVGICLVGDFEHNGPPSARQMASLRQLIGFLQARANIASAQVIGHGSVPSRNTECPGRHLDMNALRASLGGTFSSSTPAPGPAPAPEMAYADKPATAVFAKSAPAAQKPALIKAVLKP